MREPHHPSSAELELSTVLHALSDPARLRIVRHLEIKGECTCGHLDLDVSDATRSHHLRVLREAGVMRCRPDGRKRYLTLRRDDLDLRFPGLLDAVMAESADGRPSPSPVLPV